MLSFERLKSAVASGEIDTVVVAFTDMAGQLVGKRFHGEFFVEAAHVETHACNYLLANDIEMEPVPGYSAASWHQGYGDFTLKPDLGTLRRIPWLPATALVLADVDRSSRPRHPAQPARDPEEAGRPARRARLESLSSRPNWNSICSTRATPISTPATIATRRLRAITSRIITSSRPPRKSR